MRTDPNQPATRADYPYLRDSSQVPESQAVPGPPPQTNPAYVRAGDPPPPPGQLGNFQGEVRYEPIRPGETVYRDLGEGQRAAGPYWGPTPTASDDVLRSDLAVLNSWNGGGGQVAYTPTAEVPAWRGEVGPQYGTGSPTTGAGQYHLPGGGQQIFIDSRSGPFPGADMTPDASGGYPQWQIGQTPW